MEERKERKMLSAGVDLGTSTTQLVLSRLTVRNTASAFAAPHLAITDKEIVYRSEIHFTPLLSETEIDAEAVAKILEHEYRAAGIARGEVETGAVIITGETARKENAREVLSALSGYAGDFVVATAGPDLEGVLAGKGAGCGEYSEERRVPVLNVDIGGGTSNFCLFSRGEPVETGCLNVGGRLIKLDGDGVIRYVSPVLDGLGAPRVGERATPERLRPVIETLVTALEEGARLRPRTELSRRLTTNRLPELNGLEERPVLSFSGGVADLIYAEAPPDWLAYGDIGVLLGRAIRASALFKAPHLRPKETIRATVVGAGSHATALTGSTIAWEGVTFPMKNLPVLALGEEEAALPPAALAGAVSKKLSWHFEGGAPEPVALALRGRPSPSFEALSRLADGLTEGLRPLTDAGLPLVIALAEDMGKALGQAMLCRLAPPRRLLCMDGLDLRTGSYLDVGKPVGPALPVVVKTLLFSS